MQTILTKWDGRNEGKTKKIQGIGHLPWILFLETIEETFAVDATANKCERIPLLTGLLVTVSRTAKRPTSLPMATTNRNSLPLFQGATSSMSAWQSKHIMCTVFVARTELRQQGH